MKIELCRASEIIQRFSSAMRLLSFVLMMHLSKIKFVRELYKDEVFWKCLLSIKVCIIEEGEVVIKHIFLSKLCNKANCSFYCSKVLKFPTMIE